MAPFAEQGNAAGPFRPAARRSALLPAPGHASVPLALRRSTLPAAPPSSWPGRGDSAVPVPISRSVTQAHINRIATALPRHEVHDAFRTFAGRQITDPRTRSAFARLAERSQIDRRFSVLEPDA